MMALAVREWSSTTIAFAGTAIVLSLAAIVFVAVALGRRVRGDGFCLAVLRQVNELYVRALHRLRSNACTVPASGPAILVANHTSGLDPALLAARCRRRIVFLMAREYYDWPALQWFFRMIDAIPVRRDGSDLAATKRALQALRNGRVVGIFPQGGIRRSDEPGLAGSDATPQEEGVKAGVALLALRAGAPVIPAFIRGTPRKGSVLATYLTPSRSEVIFGEVFELARPAGRNPTRQEVRQAAHEIFDRVLELETGVAREDANQARTMLSRPSA